MADVVARVFRGSTPTVHVVLQCSTNHPDWTAVEQLWQKIYAAADRFYFVVDIRAMGLTFTLANVMPIYTLLSSFRARSDAQVISTILICNQSVQQPMINAVTALYVPTRPMQTVATDDEAFAMTGSTGLPEIL